MTWAFLCLLAQYPMASRGITLEERMKHKPQTTAREKRLNALRAEREVKQLHWIIAIMRRNRQLGLQA